MVRHKNDHSCFVTHSVLLCSEKPDSYRLYHLGSHLGMAMVEGYWQEVKGWVEGEVRICAPDHQPGPSSRSCHTTLSGPQTLLDGLSSTVMVLAGLLVLLVLECGGEG